MMELSRRTARKVSAGKYHPCGATLTPEGVNFALYSQSAGQVFLVLFDSPEGEPTDVIPLEQRTKFVWHAFVHGLEAGQLYGYRAAGDFRPERGLRFNPAKLLMDPYAKALTGKFRNQDNLLLAYDPLSQALDLSLDDRDDASIVPKSIVVDDAFDWQGEALPDIPLEKLVIYETHLKGFTAHPSSQVEFPGTYLGFLGKIPHLKGLGVNAVELLPIHEFYVEDFLAAKGLTNYWGYNTVGFFAPESSYSTGRGPGCQVREFKTLVRELHKAGIEIILDVVYNHTGEGSELGPTLCLKGIDNTTYYALSGPHHQPARHYMNYTGCGNSLNISHPQAVRLVMDSLRYWVETMRVDGFRFDLASVLGRDGGDYRRTGSFFDAVSQDPVLSRVKLIAEPWDIGTYQVGNFPVDWSEWNGRFRDAMRRFAKGDGGMLREVGWRVTGSSDLYGDDGRSAYNSVNFLTCHDGFTLQDLVSYDRKHNDDNLEHNNDGSNDNDSWNCGAEGETRDPGILALRLRLAKNHACHLIFSCGTPMILGGDEFLRTQKGNNNAYCQDNGLSWHDWTLPERNADFLRFFRMALAFTLRRPVLLRRKFLTGADEDLDGIPDISWFGTDLGPPRWEDPECRTLCYMLDASPEGGADERLFFILNADPSLQRVALPPLPPGLRWHRVVDTNLPSPEDFMEEGAETPLSPEDHYLVNGRSTVVLLAFERGT